MVKLKEGVTGFIYDSSNGFVTKMFTKHLTQDQIQTINEVIDEDSVLFVDNEDVNDYFDFGLKEGEEIGCEEDGLNLVIEWVD